MLTFIPAWHHRYHDSYPRKVGGFRKDFPPSLFLQLFSPKTHPPTIIVISQTIAIYSLPSFPQPPPSHTPPPFCVLTRLISSCLAPELSSLWLLVGKIPGDEAKACSRTLVFHLRWCPLSQYALELCPLERIARSSRRLRATSSHTAGCITGEKTTFSPTILHLWLLLVTISLLPSVRHLWVLLTKRVLLSIL